MKIETAARKILRSIKTQLILYLICLAIFLAAREQDWVFLFTTLVAVISALAIEEIVSYLKTKTLRISESAIITGLIIGYVLSSDEAWWKFAAAGSIAILSKHLIRFKNKHIFNPAAVGIFLTLVLLGASTQWRATYLWYILAPLGIYFAYRVNKIELLIGYAIGSWLLFGVQALLQGGHGSNIFGYFSHFYIFVMVIEPKTTPLKPFGKYIFGAGVATLIFILIEIGVRFDAELLSLLAMNAAVPLLNKIP